jgi:hypothetical protein
MGNTANNNWPYPESTDLVKDGATAIENLADAIDTTLGVYANPGLVLLNTTSFSGVSSASAPTDTFTSTYTDYYIKCNVTLSASTTLRFRMRLAGSDATGSNYTTQYLYGTGATTGAGNTTEAIGYLAIVDAAGRTTVDFNLYNPQLAVNTFSSSKFLTSALSVGTCGVSHGVATAYDSITILPGSGTITGDMAIYGLAK